MADRQDRVVAALNFLTGEGIDYHPDGCDQETLALINDYFSAPKMDEESGSSDSEDEIVKPKQSSTTLNESLMDTDVNADSMDIHGHNAGEVNMGPTTHDDNDDYNDYVDMGLIEEHEPVDLSACLQSPQATSQSEAPVVSSICSRPRLDEVASDGSATSGSQLVTENSSTTPDDNNPTCQPWEQEQLNELSKCAEFVRLTCGCSKADGKPCSGLFTEDHYAELRAQACFLTHEQLDLVILGSIMATIRKDDVSHGRHKPAKRQKTMMTYMHHGHHLCVRTYNFLHGIGSHRVKHVKASYLMYGLATRTHGNSNKAPANTLSYQSICHLAKFIQNYAEQHAILLPGRVPQLKRYDVKLLPCSDSKKNVWKHYKRCCATITNSTVQVAAYRTFCRYWTQLLPYIVVSKPRSDLCWVCHQNSTSMSKLSNKPDEEKMKVIDAAKDHMSTVTTERSIYREVCKSSRQIVKDTFTSGGSFHPPAPGSLVAPVSNDIKIHYSFDMAQQVHYPSDPFQPGPVYFLTPRKCAVFGVCCEAIPRQITYLVDEAYNVGKGANAIISMLHHFFNHHGLGETTAHLHADNCSGQNKNRYVMSYLMWRVLTGLHREITISFLPVGHTKFAPDWCFGLFKQRFWRTKINILDDIASAIDNSSVVNVPQLVGTLDGQCLVPTYNWSNHSDEHTVKTALKGIKKNHHFRFTSSSPGAVFVKKASGEDEKEINLLKDPSWRPSCNELPDLIIPQGLSLERQWYLFEKIREFCSDSKDLVCPKPLHPLT